MENKPPTECPVSGDPLSESPHVVLDKRAAENGIYCVVDLLGTIKATEQRINSGELIYDEGNAKIPFFYPKSINDIDKIIPEQWIKTGLRSYDNSEFSVEDKKKIVELLASNHKEGDKVIIYYFHTKNPEERALYATNSPTPLVKPYNAFMNKFGKPAGLSGAFPNRRMPYPIRKVPSTNTRKPWRGGKKRATRRKHLRKRSSTHKRKRRA